MTHTHTHTHIYPGSHIRQRSSKERSSAGWRLTCAFSQIVDKTIMEADLDRDGKISFEEFKKMVENTDVSMSMTLGENAASPASIFHLPFCFCFVRSANRSPSPPDQF